MACAGGARVVLVPCVAHCAHEGVCHTVPPTATKRHPCGGQIRERKGARASLGGGTSDNTHAPPGADGTRLGAGCWWRWQGGTPPRDSAQRLIGTAAKATVAPITRLAMTAMQRALSPATRRPRGFASTKVLSSFVQDTSVSPEAAERCVRWKEGLREREGRGTP